MRTFETTHSWITFRIDLRRATPHLWMKFGEASSKCEHIAGSPLRRGTAEVLHRLYLAKGVQATTAIEGNPLTIAEVERHLERNLRLPASKEYLGREIDNVVAACNNIEERLRANDDSLTPDRIAELNGLVLRELPNEPEVVPGQIRSYSVVVGNVYRAVPAEDCQFLLARLCDWLSSDDFKAAPGEEMVYGIVKAVVAHIYLAWIHPFGDGNGRTARLVEFQILLAAGVPTPAAHLLSNHYNQTRRDYYRHLDAASKSGGDIMPFVEYAVAGFVEGLREQIGLIREQQWDVTWENYVHDLFREKKSIAETRQKWLALDLGDSAEPVTHSGIRELSPRLAREYANKTDKTLQRDIGALEELGLIERSPKGIRAKREIILAFLPWRKDFLAPQAK